MNSRSHQRGNSTRINDTEEQAPEVGRVAFLWDWKIIIILVHMIALSLEPLFLYGLMINEYKKCVEVDRKLGITAIVSRSLLDISCLVMRFHTGFLGNQLRIYTRNKLHAERKGAASRPTDSSHSTPVKDKRQTDLRKCILHRHFLFDILVFLPIPQVLGASWYCFSIQRTVACWDMACENHGGCVRNSFYYCDHNFGYHSVLDDFCPKNMPNAGLFDFGVFLDAHQSDILESKNIPQKIFYCFCWGMRNLSSFGSNLRPSKNVGENCFALCITIVGLFLFQIYLQRWISSKSTAELEQKKKINCRSCKKKRRKH
ncbi:cyclic nucleotide-gated ion channel 1-like isoform X5 [Quercus lobata]|uniref:cyclic nucleotide-gated ion channel 1-like isoform X5 n=1 Tax=Quercus lobata TaxID=97700 RepID=UPI001248CB49|nr:cyclic nucleotide-gated ion channel 1-like isoform X5 [Quercus lobata]